MKIYDLVEMYINYKRSLGMSYDSHAAVLRSFCHAMGEITINELRPEKVYAFIAGSGPITTRWGLKFYILSGFYRYAQARGHMSTSTLPTQIPKLPPPMAPYIYSIDELNCLMAATDTLQTPKSSFLIAKTMRTLLLLLYSTGMRIGEALSLKIKDVALAQQCLTLHNTKFFKTRLVPIGPRLMMILSEYLSYRCQLPLPADESSAFFATQTGKPLKYRKVNRLFVRLRNVAGVQREETARYQPRLHDIRHTSAVHHVIACYRAGNDVQRFLPQLSTYLGHTNIRSTQRYLSMTPELLNEASIRFEDYVHLEVRHE